MPPSSQNLYFHLGLDADDDGVVEAYKVLKLINANDDDLKVLISKEFIKVLNDDLVVVILDWNEHNLIRADRKVDSMYKNLLLQFAPEIKVLEAKPRADTGVLPRGNSTGRPVAVSGQHRLGKDRLGKDSSNTSSAGADTPSAFDTFWDAYPKKENKKKSKEIWQRKKLDSKLPEILAFVEKAKKTDRWVEGYIKHPTGFLNGELWTDDLTLYNNRKGAPMQITKIG